MVIRWRYRRSLGLVHLNGPGSGVSCCVEDGSLQRELRPPDRVGHRNSLECNSSP